MLWYKYSSSSFEFAGRTVLYQYILHGLIIVTLYTNFIYHLVRRRLYQPRLQQSRCRVNVSKAASITENNR